MVVQAALESESGARENGRENLNCGYVTVGSWTNAGG